MMATNREVEILPPETPSDRPPFRMAGEREWLAAQAAPGGPEKRAQAPKRQRRWGRRLVAFSVIAATAALVGWRVSYGSSSVSPARDALAALPPLRWVAAMQDPPEAAPVAVPAATAAALVIDPEVVAQQAQQQAQQAQQQAEQNAEQNARIDEITRSVDRMAAEVAANQAQITQLTAGQEKLTHEILRLRVVAQAAASAAYSAAHRPQHHSLFYYRY